MSENGLNGTGPTLTPTGKGADKMILALALGATFTDAAEQADISERTVRGRMQASEWQRAVVTRRDELFAEAHGKIIGALTEAAEKLQALLGADNEQVALGAARALLDFGLRYQPGGETSTQQVNVRPTVKAELDLSEDALDVIRSLGIIEAE